MFQRFWSRLGESLNCGLGLSFACILTALDLPLKIINLSANEMSLIDPALMAQSLNKISSVTLFDSNVSVILEIKEPNF